MEEAPQEPGDPPQEAARDEAIDQGASVEIHPPHGRIDSLKDFFLQLMTITAGVLIALSLEGLLEWNHYRLLVREARETIAREIADNKREVDGALAQSDVFGKSLDAALQLVNELLSTKKSETREIGLSLSLAELTAASWQSAERTGALGRMEYAEVQEYSRLYAIQDLYTTQQRRSLERVGTAVAFLGDDPHRAEPRDLEMFRQQLFALRADLLIQDQIGRQLTQIYQKALEE